VHLTSLDTSNALPSCSVTKQRVATDVHEIDPLRDARWREFVRQHPAGSVFHTASWLEALQRTYGYEPAAMAMSDVQGNLTSALVFCRINSWITGKRIVSLPFSDHCDPLINEAAELAPLLTSVQQEAALTECKYVELRPKAHVTHTEVGLWQSRRFCFHLLSLRPDIENVFSRLHRDCIQRKIRRAERESLTITEGPTPSNLARFYGLVVRTRRRQGLLPQPFRWFRNVVDCLGPAVNIRIASKTGEAIAGLLTILNDKSITYKYGASDERFHNLGGMPYLFWLAIKDGIDRGFQEFDLGRSDATNAGLIAFKDHLGAFRSELSYWRSPVHADRQSGLQSFGLALLREAHAYIPEKCLTSLGALVYRHIG
jgi:hypothetical protein